MEYHIRAVAHLQVAFGVLGLLFSVGVFLVTDAWTAWMALLGVERGHVPVLSSLILGFLALHLGFLAVPSVAAGLGLLKFENWARNLGIVCATLQLAGFPVGTILGIYSMWALLAHESELLFRDG
jgi:hypothetical protein